MFATRLQFPRAESEHCTKRRPIIVNSQCIFVDKIVDIVESDCHVSAISITQELKIEKKKSFGII